MKTQAQNTAPTYTELQELMNNNQAAQIGTARNNTCELIEIEGVSDHVVVRADFSTVFLSEDEDSVDPIF